MIRNHLAAKGMGSDTHFHWRGGEVSRLEGFSDAVFGFALTLLVVSLQTPRTFDDLLNVMRGFVPFALCFYTLYSIWMYHYLYFRRYGLQDSVTMWLNSLLLFCVLFYVYPLRFVNTLFIEVVFGDAAVARGSQAIITLPQIRTLFVIYGIGFATVFGIFAILHVHAYRKRDALGLDRCERFTTRSAIWQQLSVASVGLISAALAVVLPTRLAGLAGYAYMLLGPVHGIHGSRLGAGLRRVIASENHATGDVGQAEAHLASS